MGIDIVHQLNRLICDIESFLRSQLEYLVELVDNGDAETQEEANEKIDAIIEWLCPPSTPLSASQRLARAVAVAERKDLTPEERDGLLDRAMRSTGRRRGRPRDEGSWSSYTIRALGLHLATGMSWREIAMRLKGCNHKRQEPGHRKARKRNPKLSCEDCGEALRVAVFRLREFLAQFGFSEGVPIDGGDLNDETREELYRLWGVEELPNPRT